MASASALLAAAFAWIAAVLPWRSWTVFAVVSAIVALGHAAVAVLAALRHRRLATVWRVQGALGLAWLLYVGWGMLSSAWYIRTLYGDLGRAIAVALVALFILVAALSLPMALWALIATGGVRLRRAHAAVAGAVLVLAGARLWWIEREARGDSLPEDTVTAVAAAIDAVDMSARRATDKRAPPLTTGAPALCEAPIDVAALTLIVTFIAGEPAGVVSRCLQAPDVAALTSAFEELVADARRAPLKVDLVTAIAALPSDTPLVALALRPGRDGVCAGVHCLMPWQLVLHDAFNQHVLLASVPDARLGASPDALRKLLVEPDAPLWRATTRSWLLQESGELLEMGPTSRAPLDRDTLANAARLAETYVLSSQNKDGRFHYMVDPFSGQLDMGDFSIARQAGTTLVICELTDKSPQARRVIARSLDMLAKLEETIQAGSETLGVMPFRIGLEEPTRRVGPSALTLASLLRCRDHVGPKHDALIGRLARHLLALQRPDGGFHHHIDRASGAPRAIDKSIFVDGQIVLGLVLLEAIADGDGLPAKAEVHAAVDRAMDHFASSYWDGFVADFFFLEENWHCLAAAAAIPVHRHDGYERLCLDYVTFKSRVVLDADSGVGDDFVGGYGISSITPPHNTATAGFGEALAAAISIKKARGMDVGADVSRLHDVLRFLVRNQWNPARCYACTRRRRIEGGFSEHMASPRIRIDYVQHAWAALGHGGRELGLL